MQNNILKNTTVLQKYVKVNASFPDTSWKPYLADALIQYIKPLTGEEILKIANEQAGTPTDSTVLQSLVELIERATACFLMSLYTNEGSLSVGDAGHTVIRTANLAPANDAKINLYKEGMQRMKSCTVF